MQFPSAKELYNQGRANVEQRHARLNPVIGALWLGGRALEADNAGLTSQSSISDAVLELCKKGAPHEELDVLDFYKGPLRVGIINELAETINHRYKDLAQPANQDF